MSTDHLPDPPCPFFYEPDIELRYAPITGFLAYLAAGWRFDLIVEPIQAHHGFWSCWLWRPA